VLAQGSQDELLTFMLVFLSTDHIKNPYLQGQFVEIMFYLTSPTQASPRGCLGDTLNFHPLALGYLMPALLRAYVQIEITGSHTQFYDKFNTRYYITQLFKLVWDNPTHREALKRESLKMDSYVKFVNLLMNDTTYLLDDALDKLAKIGEMQKQMDDTEAWQGKPAEERQEQEKLLRQWEGTARSDLDLGQEQLRLIKLFSKETKEPFLEGEIVNRLAAMLDMNLSLLAGPRCQDLKVRDPDKYKFKPTELLSDFLSIFLELGSRREFQAAVARDGRSYSKDLFARAERIALKRALKSEAELAKLREMVDQVEQIKAEDEADDALGEVPEEFEGQSKAGQEWSAHIFLARCLPRLSVFLQIPSRPKLCVTRSCCPRPSKLSTAARSASTTCRTRPTRSTAPRWTLRTWSTRPSSRRGSRRSWPRGRASGWPRPRWAERGRARMS